MKEKTGMNEKTGIWILGGLAIILGLNGLYMLIDPILWFDTTPGVKRSGAPNTHFIRDIGIIYFEIAVLIAVAIRYAHLRFALLMAGGGWLLGHAVFHFVEASCGIITWSQFLIDIPGVIVPGLLVPLLALALRPPKQETVHV